MDIYIYIYTHLVVSGLWACRDLVGVSSWSGFIAVPVHWVCFTRFQKYSSCRVNNISTWSVRAAKKHDVILWSLDTTEEEAKQCGDDFFSDPVYSSLKWETFCLSGAAVNI